MAIRTLRYVTGVGTLSVAQAYEKAETIAAILRPWYQSGKLKGYGPRGGRGTGPPARRP
jgi:hypothetical protein